MRLPPTQAGCRRPLPASKHRRCFTEVDLSSWQRCGIAAAAALPVYCAHAARWCASWHGCRLCHREGRLHLCGQRKSGAKAFARRGARLLSRLLCACHAMQQQHITACNSFWRKQTGCLTDRPMKAWARASWAHAAPPRQQLRGRQRARTQAGGGNGLAHAAGRKQGAQPWDHACRRCTMEASEG